MSGQGDQRIQEAVRAILAEGPQDVLGLLQSLRRAVPDVVGGQEGVLHGWLLGELRADALVLAGRSTRGLPRYALPPAPDPAALPTPPARTPPPMDPARSKAALTVARGARDPADRGRIVADVAAHLEHLAGVGARGKRAFGAIRTARAIVHRRDRGKRTVSFVDGMGDRLRRLALHEGPWILGAILAYVLIRTFLGDVYQIPSESMRSALTPGDRVVVHKRGGAERWRTWVFEGRDKTLVKRIVGLGGETIAVFQGDVYLDGKLATKPDPIREALRRPARTWQAQDGTLVDWTRRDEGRGRATWHPRNWPAEGDTWFGRRPQPFHAPAVPLFDGYVHLVVDLPAGGTVTLELARGLAGTDGFEGAVRWALSVSETGCHLFEFGADGEDEALKLTTPGPAPGRTSLALAYVDGQIRASCGSLMHVETRPAPYFPLQCVLRTSGGTVPVSVGLDKDVHYSHDGDRAVATTQGGPPRMQPHAIPPGHVFLLGDNPRHSEDSRFAAVGDVAVDRLVGPVVFRVWPPSRFGVPR